MQSQVEQLKSALATNRLVLVEFYATSETRNVWMEPVIEEYNRQRAKHIQVVSIDVMIDEELATAYRISMAPAFLLLLREKELWRKLGKLTVDELQVVLEEF